MADPVPTTSPDEASSTLVRSDPGTRHRRTVAILVILAVVVIAGIVVGGVVHNRLGESATCITVDSTYSVTPEQAANAADITAVAVRRHLPRRAATIALATALQESKLKNLTGGDRDSVGLFQQRPSQGWGRPAQLMDTRYAAGAFYDALLKVPRWQNQPLTDVAQAVQRSGFPGAYAKWSDEASALTGPLVGANPAGLACRYETPPRGSAATASGALVAALPLLRAPTTTNPAAPDVATMTVTVSETSYGWVVASWLVAHGDQLAIESISFAGRQWHRGDLTWSKPDHARDPQVAVTFAAGKR